MCLKQYEKEVAGFEIAMYDIGGVHEEQAAEYLIDKVLDVVIAEFLPRVDHPVQVGLHEVGDDVDVSVASACFGLEDVQQPDDIVMLEEF
jgi:hypothetical protein